MNSDNISTTSKSNKDKNSDALDQSIAKNIEFSELDNEHIKKLIEDKNENLRNGVYGCIDRDKGNYYIFINGVDYWYSNISFDIKNKLLTIKYNTNYEKGLKIKYLFLIKFNNIELFDKVQLINNGSKQQFHILFQ